MLLRNMRPIIPYVNTRDVFKYLTVAIVMLTTLCVSSSTGSDICDTQGNGLRLIIEGNNNIWLYIWDSNGVIKEDTGYVTKRYEDITYVYKGFGDKRAETLPQSLAGPNMRFDAPFLVSHNGKILIATIHPDYRGFGLPTKLAIVDLNRKSLIGRIENGDYILSVAWQPTDKYFAVLFSHDATREKWRGPFDWIAAYLGHPISYFTIIAAIFNAEGKLVCKRTIAERLKHGQGYLEWEK